MLSNRKISEAPDFGESRKSIFLTCRSKIITFCIIMTEHQCDSFRVVGSQMLMGQPYKACRLAHFVCFWASLRLRVMSPLGLWRHMGNIPHFCPLNCPEASHAWPKRQVYHQDCPCLQWLDTMQFPRETWKERVIRLSLPAVTRHCAISKRDLKGEGDKIVLACSD